MARPGEATHTAFFRECSSGAWPGTARLGEAGLHTQRGGIPVAVRRGWARPGAAWLGEAWLGYTHCILRGAEVWRGRAGRGMAWLGKHTASLRGC